MWIVIGVIGFHFYFELFSANEYPIAEEFLISIPNNFLDSIVNPSFSKILQLEFWVIVISITLIAAIESLLSIKAIDKLDSENRRSNTNKDLKAIGIATSISGFFGGLPVVAVIARSSVNVNHSASNSSSNFFHAGFVFVFVVLFSNYLNMIPLSALAGILVYTGYRLASPAHFRKMYKWGKDQFIIYIATILGTLLFGLIPGVLTGILFTLLVQIILLRKQSQSFTNPFRPNTLLFQEEDGKLFLSVKGNATFLNYLNLKRKLDSIPPKHHVILDLSLTNFVDNSVMENIFQYQVDFKKNDSILELIGLDAHERTSNHPFAARKYLKLTSIVSKSGLITVRQQKLKEFAKEINWSFKTNPIKQIDELERFRFFKFKQIDHAYNIFKGEHNGVKLKLMDVDFYEGELTTRERHKLTIFTFKLRNRIPEFRLDKERIFDRIAGFAGLKDISIPGHEDFSKRFLLRGKDEDRIKDYFSDSLILFFESNSYYHVESNGTSIMIFRKQRLATISEIKALAFFGVQLIERSASPLRNQTTENK
jgi:MFS superfamily sulfate permease-like transporter